MAGTPGTALFPCRFWISFWHFDSRNQRIHGTVKMLSPWEALNIKDLARSLGFDLAAFTSVEPAAEDRDFFLGWCGEGKAAGMAWLEREPARRAEPRSLLK